MSQGFRALVIGACVVGAQLVAAGVAHAASIFIADCQGFTRAVKQVDPGSLNQVDVSITDASGLPADGVQVELVNSVTGERIVVVCENGVASFPGVTSGVFTITTVASGMQIGAISISSGVVALGSAGAAAVGAGLVVGGGAVAVVAVDEVANDGGGDDEPTPTPTPAATSAPTPRPTIRPTVAPTPTEICDPDAMPTPIDTFFPGGIVPQGTPLSAHR